LEAFIWLAASCVGEEVLELIIGWPVLAYVANEALTAYKVGLNPAFQFTTSSADEGLAGDYFFSAWRLADHGYFDDAIGWCDGWE